MDAEECPNCQTKFVVPEEDHKAEKPESTTPHRHEALRDEPQSTPDKSNDNYVHTPTKRDTPWYLLLLAIIIIGVAGYLYWDNYQDRIASEEKAYAALQDCNDPLNYEDFIARFPNSKYVDDVRDRLKELEQEDALWNKVLSSHDVNALQNYIDTHPTSPHKKEALHKIDSIDWRQAKQQETSAAFEAYIERHPDGTYISEAYNAQANAKAREERARRDSIAALQRDTIAPEPVATEGATATPQQAQQPQQPQQPQKTQQTQEHKPEIAAE